MRKCANFIAKMGEMIAIQCCCQITFYYMTNSYVNTLYFPDSIKIISIEELGALVSRNFSSGIIKHFITCPTHTDRVSRNLIGSKPVCKSPYSPEKFYTSTGCPAPMFAGSVYRVNTTNKLKQCGSRKAL